MLEKFINLTTHTINEITSAQSFKPSGQVARVKQSTDTTASHAGCPLYTTKFGAIEGLPEPSEGVVYIVSALALNSVHNRTDVVSPGNLQRDEDGKPIGCIGFRTQ